jgi:hypothetical protein
MRWNDDMRSSFRKRDNGLAPAAAGWIKHPFNRLKTHWEVEVG